MLTCRPPKHPILVYVAGKYTAKTTPQLRMETTSLNIRVADQIGHRIFKMGFCVLIPHNNTALWDFKYDDFTQEQIMNQCYRLMDSCDAIFLIPGWQESEGTQLELAYAKRIGLAIFSDINALEAWQKRLKGM